MKVLYDYEIFLIQKYGGATRYFYEIISRLVQMNELEIILYMGHHINKYELEKFEDKYLKFYGKRIRHIPKTKLILQKLHKPIFESFRRKNEYNVFHHTYFADYKKKNGTKDIITVHDFTHEKFPDNFSGLDKTIKAKAKAIKNADGIICVSNTTKNDLLNLYKIPEEKIRVIYHGNSLNYEVKEKAFFEKPYLLYVGDRRAYKNFNLVLSAFNNSDLIRNNFCLLCFGGGKFKKKEKDVIYKYGLGEKVFQTEGSDKELANAYKYANAFIYPSLYEGFGIPLLEAMHYGCPIVASDSSCFPEIAGDAAMYFNPKSVEDLILKIENVINNKEIRNQLIKNGYEREKLFGWEKCATLTFEFYKNILNA
ncbi:MAG: glycosyltransferase family 1 protein [Ignavibacteria bacterium]